MRYGIDKSIAGESVSRLTEITGDTEVGDLAQAATTTFARGQLRSQTRCFSSSGFNGFVDYASCATASREFCKVINASLDPEPSKQSKKFNPKDRDKENARAREIKQLSKQLNLPSQSKPEDLTKRFEELGQTCNQFSNYLSKAFTKVIEADRGLINREVIDQDFAAIKAELGKTPPFEGAKGLWSWIKLTMKEPAKLGLSQMGLEDRAVKFQHIRSDFMAFTHLVQTCATKSFVNFNEPAPAGAGSGSGGATKTQ